MSQQVAAAEREVEDDELSNTMYIVPFERWYSLNLSGEQGA